MVVCWVAKELQGSFKVGPSILAMFQVPYGCFNKLGVLHKQMPTIWGLYSGPSFLEAHIPDIAIASYA